MKFTTFMEMVEAATNEFKTFYLKYYSRKQNVYDKYQQPLEKLEQAIQKFTEELKETDVDRLQRLTNVYEDLLEKRKKEWAEYQIDFDILWEKHAAIRAKYPQLLRHKYPQLQCETHPIFKLLFELRSANICPKDALVLINGLQTELDRSVSQMEKDLEQAVQKDRFKKEKNVFQMIIFNNPKAAQMLLYPSENPSEEASKEQQKMKIILGLSEQIDRLKHSWWNPFMPNKNLLSDKQAVLYQLIHKFYDTSNVGKKVEDIFDEWLASTTIFEKHPTDYKTLIGYHRNAFFQRNRPGVQTNSEEIIDQLKTQYGRMTL